MEQQRKKKKWKIWNSKTNKRQGEVERLRNEKEEKRGPGGGIRKILIEGIGERGERNERRGRIFKNIRERKKSKKKRKEMLIE